MNMMIAAVGVDLAPGGLGGDAGAALLGAGLLIGAVLLCAAALCCARADRQDSQRAASSA